MLRARSLQYLLLRNGSSRPSMSLAFITESPVIEVQIEDWFDGQGPNLFLIVLSTLHLNVEY